MANDSTFSQKHGYSCHNLGLIFRTHLLIIMLPHLQQQNNDELKKRETTFLKACFGITCAIFSFKNRMIKVALYL